MKKLDICYLFTKISFALSILESSDSESSLYFNIWYLGFIMLTGGLISLGGGIGFILDTSSFTHW